MSRAKLIDGVTELTLAEIRVTDDRLRPVTEAAALALADSIREHGLVYPLIVRRVHSSARELRGQFELVDGANRRAALLSLGWETVPVRCYEGPASAIRLLEIDTNLARADLSDLDRAIHMAARRREYIAEHPETAQGVAGAAARWNATAESAVASFVNLTAETTGLKPRDVRRYIEAGSVLDTLTAEQLRSSGKRVFVNDLLALAKASPDDRPAAVKAFASGEAQKLASALKAARSDIEPTIKDPVEERFLALLKAFDRAGVVALRRLVAERFDVLSPLVVDEAEIRDADDIAQLRGGLEAAE